MTALIRLIEELEDELTMREVEIESLYDRLCDTCEGHGDVRHADGVIDICPACYGTGEKD